MRVSSSASTATPCRSSASAPTIDCTDLLPLTPDEYASARAEEDRFILLPGHVPPGEDIVMRYDGYVITRRSWMG